MKTGLTLAIAILVGAYASTAQASTDNIDVVKFSPPIVATSVPLLRHGWDIHNTLLGVSLNQLVPTVPAYDGNGKLIASWKPQVDIFDRPTVIVGHGGHGGHGIVPSNLETALWAERTLRANILILDSYWSRGIDQNWLTWTRYGANMRTLDAVAAARFVKSEGADPAKTFYIGDSQGGWTALRIASGHALASEVKSLFAGSIALYPNCFQRAGTFSPRAPNGELDRDMSPPLGNYHLPLLIFTGSADTATPTSQCDESKTLKTAEKWVHFEGGTHSWDSPNRGVGRRPEDGKCTFADNIYNRFKMCHNAEFTSTTRQEKMAFIRKHLPAPVASTTPEPQPRLTQQEIDRRAAEIMKGVDIR